MPHPFLGIGFTSPLFSKFSREETKALLELTTKSDVTDFQLEVTSTGSTWTYQVDWGDGSIENFTESNVGINDRPSHTYSSAGVYEIKFIPTGSTTTLIFSILEKEKITMVDGVGSSEWTEFGLNGTLLSFASNLNSVSSSLDTSNVTRWYGSFYKNSSLTPFPLLDTSSATFMEYVWYENTSLTSFPLIDTSNVTTLTQCWANCTELTSFPSIDTSSVVSTGGDGTATGFYGTWYNCNKLTSFPIIDVSSATSLEQTWRLCSSLTSFPDIDTSNITNFKHTWQQCSGLTSFPSLNFQNGELFIFTWYQCSGMTAFPGSSQGFSSATDFMGAWDGCTNLADFAPDVFDGCSCTDFTGSFYNCSSLTPQSIENILTSIDSNNTSNGTLGFGGTTPGESTWTTAALTAKANLVTRNWTVISNT